jgi:hypothetical protein
MTVREMIEALQELHMPDALIVRGDYRDNPPRVYHERGSSWDIVEVRQDAGRRSSQWFISGDAGRHDENVEIKWAVVI